MADEIKVEWADEELKLSDRVIPADEIIERYKKAMAGKVCRVCSEGFPALKSGKLMGIHFDQFLDRHVEWGQAEMYDHPDYGYVHTTCHDFEKHPGSNFQFLKAESKPEGT